MAIIILKAIESNRQLEAVQALRNLTGCDLATAVEWGKQLSSGNEIKVEVLDADKAIEQLKTTGITAVAEIVDEIPAENTLSESSTNNEAAQKSDTAPEKMSMLRTIRFWGMMICAFVIGVVMIVLGKIIAGIIMILAGVMLCPIILNKLSWKKRLLMILAAILVVSISSLAFNMGSDEGSDTIEYVKQYHEQDAEFAIGEFFDLTDAEKEWSFREEGDTEYVSVKYQEADGMVEVIFKIESEGQPVLYDVLLDNVHNDHLYSEIFSYLFESTDHSPQEVTDNTSQETPTEAPTVESEASESTVDHSADFIGGWSDSYSQRCYMEISCEDGINYTIDIQWATSAFENAHWIFSGVFDEDEDGIKYTGVKIIETYNNGTENEHYEYMDGEGVIYIGRNGKLYWEDYKENAGEDCVFESGNTEQETSPVSDSGSANSQIDSKWYLNYDSFYDAAETRGNRVDINLQNDVVLCISITDIMGYTLDWTVGTEPDEIGQNGELIYYDGSFSLSYYPTDHHIHIKTSDPIYIGDYWPI